MGALQELSKLAEVARKPGLQAELADRFDGRGWTDREGAPTHAVERRPDGTTEVVEISAKVPRPRIIPGFTFEIAETGRGLINLCCHSPAIVLPMFQTLCAGGWALGFLSALRVLPAGASV